MMRQALIYTVLCSLLTPAMAEKPTDWFYDDYAKAQAEAQQQNKPLYLHFTTDGCVWCRKLENDVYRTEEGKEVLSDYVCVSLALDGPDDKGREYARMMREMGSRGGVPFLAFQTPDGMLLHSFPGYRPMEDFKKEVQKADEKLQTWREFQEFASTAKKDSYEYNRRALDVYSDFGQWDQAAKAAKALKAMDAGEKDKPEGLIEYALLQEVVTARRKELLQAMEANDQARVEKVMESYEPKIQELRQQVIAKDPKNAEGVLEKLLGAEAMQAMTMAQGAQSRMQRAQKLQEVVALLEELTTKAETLENPASVYHLLGFTYANLQQYDKSVEALQKASEHSTVEEQKAEIQRAIEQIKAARDAQNAARQTNGEPAANQP